MNEQLLKKKGLMVIISSPSGAGKTTLTRKIISDMDDTVLSISVTTRKKRPNEEEGLHYYFINEDTFNQMVMDGNLLESANVFGYNYGTPKDRVLENIQAGKDVIFDIDWQGASQLRENFKENILSIFILPPSAGELMSRLIKRDQDSLDVIKKRLNSAYDEIKHWHEYDYIIINDDLEKSYNQLRSIIIAERMKISKTNSANIDLHVKVLMEELSGRL
jgi:guanylate kinase|tara:strand:- start:27 stop:683 length:657 start_codon:yes stop_codon:yes gene_type:complete